MVSRERPITLSPPVWAFLQSAFETESLEAMRSILREEGYALPASTTTEDLFAAIVEMPGPFLLRMGILKRPELLRGTVLSFEVEPGLPVDYVVKTRTVEGLRAGDAVLITYRLLDNQEYAVPRDRFVRSIHDEGLVDYLEKETG